MNDTSLAESTALDFQAQQSPASGPNIFLIAPILLHNQWIDWSLHLWIMNHHKIHLQNPMIHHNCHYQKDHHLKLCNCIALICLILAFPLLNSLLFWSHSHVILLRESLSHTAVMLNLVKENRRERGKW